MNVTVIATGLAEAVAKDEEDGLGFDLSGGVFGNAVSAWIRSIAKDFDDLGQQIVDGERKAKDGHDFPAWQQMDTAPKDGKRVLLVINHGEWGDKVWTGLWADGWMVSYGRAATEPTHWMPLPKAPI